MSRDRPQDRRRDRRWDRRCLVAGAAWGLVLVLSTLGNGHVEARQSPASVWAGVYTKAQARRGQQIFTDVCMYCHGPDLNGEEMGPPLRGSSFYASWRDQAVLKLFVKISDTMPGDAPGTLNPQAAIDVLTFLLEANLIPAGSEELRPDPALLEQIVITGKPAR